MNDQEIQRELSELRQRIERLERQQLMNDLPVPALIPSPEIVLSASTQMHVPAPVIEEPLLINEEWKTVLHDLNNGSDHLFITGDAGTGKSTLLKHFSAQYWGDSAILAPTGVAALRVGGQTIHSFFRFGAHAQTPDDIEELESKWQKKYKALNTLIIDEISMVRADYMDAIDLFLRKNGKYADRPFGGVRIVTFGDLFQLPPIAKEKDEKKWLAGRYGTELPFFFYSEVWRSNPLKMFELTTIFRQNDPVFTGALNQIRRGNANAETLALINSRVNPNFVVPKDELWITLTTTNDNADYANKRMLAQLPDKSKMFIGQTTGNFDLKNAPTDIQLELKPGAVVMFVRNNKQSGWVNGTLGKVVSVDPLRVEIEGRHVQVEPETWESMSYIYDNHTKKLTRTVTGEFIQIPLKLASAITIHKAQGLTFDRCVIDFGSGAFAAGQSYVALSRCRTLEGMILRRPVSSDDLIVSKEVQKFMAGEPIATPAPANLPLFGEEVHVPETDV